ncbi:MAG: hypothetical protein A3C55_05325 [Gammaproteobacteria bacterium RIFCSPHIGHO2_02_FULL_42_13]|nr:MAG: hypothetical protein A3C55_05325 [Gammaproteobacteria bacterium RIFCSPHIGHO2_02_FULL_42_13]OGT68229.1 MAG: hypothetical protein A3H43_05175 [Gammaproteobacteria bacterium RIFCSPLOWO2_02_FULL_42_9]
MKMHVCIIISMPLLLLVATSFGWRDPTQPSGINSFADASASISDRSKVTLSAILSSLDRNIAVVNGQYLQAGDAVDNITVMAITPSAVDFKDAEGEFTVMLYSDVKQPVKENASP